MIDLTNYALQINKFHNRAEKGIAQWREDARRAGHLLIDVKKELPRGEFVRWVRNNTELSHRTANSYMRFARGKYPTITESRTGQNTTDMPGKARWAKGLVRGVLKEAERKRVFRESEIEAVLVEFDLISDMMATITEMFEQGKRAA